MEQELFEQAIAPYTVKQVDKNNPVIVSYELRRAFRVESLEKVETGFKLKRNALKKPSTKFYVTPAGEFDSPDAAAKHYNISVANLYNRITKSRKLNNKDYYIYEKDETNQSC